MRRALLFCAGLAAALLSACATATTPEQQAVAPAAPPGERLSTAPFGDLVEQWTATPGSLFVKRPRPDFAAYRSLRIETPAIYYGEQTLPPLRQDHELLLGALRGLVAQGAPAAIGLPAGETRGTGVLRVRSEVNDLDVDRSRTVGNTRVTSIIQPGRAALFVLELADDATGEPLLRVAASRALPGGIYTGPWSPELDRARQLFRGFADDASETLAVVFGEPSASP